MNGENVLYHMTSFQLHNSGRYVAANFPSRQYRECRQSAGHVLMQQVQTSWRVPETFVGIFCNYVFNKGSSSNFLSSVKVI